MTVHTTYFAAIDHGKVDPKPEDLLLGVVRRPQDWMTSLVDKNSEALGPPVDLLEAYKSVEETAEADDDISNPSEVAWSSVQFAEQYREYLVSANLASVLGTLREREQESDIWLVCYEKDPQFCHRRLLAEELTRGREETPVHHPEPGLEAEQEDSVPDARLDDFQEEPA